MNVPSVGAGGNSAGLAAGADPYGAARLATRLSVLDGRSARNSHHTAASLGPPRLTRQVAWVPEMLHLPTYHEYLASRLGEMWDSIVLDEVVLGGEEHFLGRQS